MELIGIEQEWEEEMTNGPSPAASREYQIVTDDIEYPQITAEADLRAELVTLGHTTYGNLPVSNIVVKRLRASKCFRGIVTYGMRELPDHGTWDAKVDSRPESRKMFRGVAAGTSVAAPGETAPENSGMLGVNGDKEAVGVEVYFPVKTYNVQVYWRSTYLIGTQTDPNYQSLQAYVDMLKTLETKVNDTYFEFLLVGALERFQPGECLLVSANRSWASPGLIRIDLELKAITLYQDALLNSWFGTATDISGWDDVQWPTRKTPHAASRTLVPVPYAGLINPTYGRANLNKLLVPTPP